MDQDTLTKLEKIKSQIRQLINQHNDLARKSDLDNRLGIVIGSGARKAYKYSYDENDSETEIEREYFEEYFAEIDVEEFEDNGWFPSSFC